MNKHPEHQVQLKQYETLREVLDMLFCGVWGLTVGFKTLPSDGGKVGGLSEKRSSGATLCAIMPA